jgi:hypothetical protein
LFNILIFAGLAVLLVVAVVVQTTRNRSRDESTRRQPGPHGASQTPSGSAARKERSRRRAQSRHDRRKRH